MSTVTAHIVKVQNIVCLQRSWAHELYVQHHFKLRLSGAQALSGCWIPHLAALTSTLKLLQAQ